MQKTLIFVTLVLLGSVACQQVVGGDVNKCFDEAVSAIKLAKEIKKDYQAKDVAALINDAALGVDLGMKMYNDCNILGEINEELGSCVQSLKFFIATSAEIKESFTLNKAMESVEKLMEAAQSIQSECPNSKEELKELFQEKTSSRKTLQASATPLTWTPTFPFNVTECLQGTTDLSATFGKLWYAINAGESTGNIIKDISAITVAVQPLLRTCGEGKVADFIAKELPKVCLESISEISQTFVDIFEHRENTVYVLTALAKVYTNFVNLRDNCPFLKVLPELQPYDFENHQRIIKEAEALSQAAPVEQETSKGLFKYNVTTCIKESEKLSREVDVFRMLYLAPTKQATAMVESLIKIKEQLHVFFAKCGMEGLEQKLESILPQLCVDTSRELLHLLVETFSGDYILAEVIDILPRVYIHLTELNDKCPKVLPKGFLPK